VATYSRPRCSLEPIKIQYKWDSTSDNANFLIALKNIEIVGALSCFKNTSFSLDTDSIDAATSNFSSILHKTAKIALVRKKEKKGHTETL